MRKITIAANWKEYLTQYESIELCVKLGQADVKVPESMKKERLISKKNPRIMIFPDVVHLPAIIKKGSNFLLGLQDLGHAGPLDSEQGSSINACIVGHSDRRIKDKEDNDTVLKKFKELQSHLYNNVYPILCVGETEDEKEEGLTLDVIKKQLPIKISNEYEKALFSGNTKNLRKKHKNFAIAYEPVWSIGSGKVPTNTEIESVLRNINRLVDGNADLFYGGSVNQNNVEKLLEIDLIDGFLIGGASTKFESLIGIIEKVDKFLKKTN